MTPTKKSGTVERMIESGREAEEVALEALRKFLDTVDSVFPDVGQEGPRRKIIDSAIKMTEQLVDTWTQLAEKIPEVVRERRRTRRPSSRARSRKAAAKKTAKRTTGKVAKRRAPRRGLLRRGLPPSGPRPRRPRPRSPRPSGPRPRRPRRSEPLLAKPRHADSLANPIGPVELAGCRFANAMRSSKGPSTLFAAAGGNEHRSKAVWLLVVRGSGRDRPPPIPADGPPTSRGVASVARLVEETRHRRCDANPPVPPLHWQDGRAIISLFPATPGEGRFDGRTLSEALGAPTSCGLGHLCPGQSHLSPLRNIPVSYHRTPAWSDSHGGAGDQMGVHRRTSLSR